MDRGPCEKGIMWKSEYVERRLYGEGTIVVGGDYVGGNM